MQRQTKRLTRVIIVRLLIYGGVLLAVAFFVPNYVRSQLYPAPNYPVPDPPPPPLRLLELTLSTGERVPAWLWAREQAGTHLPVVVFFHGNGENLGSLWDSGSLVRLHDLGVHVVAVEYPGYGRATGIPSEASLLETGGLAVDKIGQVYPHNPKYLMGWSLGAAVAMQTAVTRQDRLRGLVLLSPWSSLHDVVSAHFPGWLTTWAIRERYDSVAAARRMPLPALVIHGLQDTIIPAAQGKRVADALPNARWLAVNNAEHNDLLSATVIWEAIRQFLVSTRS